ncbi:MULTISPECIES: Bug family tripartite tricarboxylate transporter substrate binding protein [Brachybacterium]|uniref:Bug family tripartite tricarboxylate transporter substrate binding protein n=1 Tax=Brachybacterium TaxID=43668 RepID=UPI000BB6A0B6|nr:MULTISPECIES: tripartite tricarboxylate transporter substrate binding protein [Brachybacterium]PCC34347.1 tricarboxylic transporter [Brachybacterium alimentarium]RCS60596.1 tripartite tricarboxylate transporter substrate binding protein [Brachybacterium sp. JB7]RCS75811.1 tripartite tricarboxylate transporter substrate binding protein [Brachybacterium alimentarium]RCS76345.1 tripartite tricarboxylate transporter substrate binding protein [Brachybacterium alimentarium]
MRRRTLLYGGFTAVVAGTTAAALANGASTAGGSEARSTLTLIAPAATGGGWDGFARESQQVLREESIVNNVQVVNIPGAGGTIGLSQFIRSPGNPSSLLVTGGVMVGAIALGEGEATFDDVVPIARLADDYAAIVVPADSELETLDDLLEAWTDDPGGTSISGGSLGSIDHLLSGRLAQVIGIDPEDLNYVAYSGGGEALNSLLSHTTTIGVSGYNEVADQVEAGTLRAIAISAEERLPGVDVPTFVELGTDVAMSNWRGVVAAPGITDEVRDQFVDIVTEMRDSDAWAETLQRNDWTDSFLTGDEFADYIRDEAEQAAEIVEDLGL